MTGFFNRLKHLLGSTETHSLAPALPAVAVIEPAGFSIDQCQHDFYRSIFGEAEQGPALSVPQRLVVDVTSKTLKQQDRRLKAVPRLPSVIPKLLHSLRDPNSSAKDYVSIINKDPVLSAAVLKLANSVYFNPRAKRITSIEIGVVKLGIEGLRSVLSAAVMLPVIRCKSEYFSQFGHKLWDHSLCCAVTCELIARQQGLEPYKAYLLGLVHDIGKITLFSELSNQFALNKESKPPGYSAFVPLMQSNAARLSATIGQDWQLPEELCEALGQQVNLQAGQAVSRYANLLFQANLACEIYVLARHLEQQGELNDSMQEAIGNALKTLRLPTDLFDKLDSLSVQV